jgi:hypothetical protein
MQGGYYKYDIDEQLSILGLNSIYFGISNGNGPNAPVDAIAA